MPRRLLLTCLMCLLVSAGGWANTQAVNNGDFEPAALGPWTTDSCGPNCSTWSLESTDVHSGHQAAMTIGSHEIMQVLPAYNGVDHGVFTGLIDETHLWFKTSASLFGIELFYYNPPGVPPSDPNGTCASSGVVCFEVDVATQNTWVDYGPQLLHELQYGSGSGKFLSEVLIGSFQPSGEPPTVSYLDGVSIIAQPTFNPVPEPTSLLLIGSGLAALAARRCRLKN